MCCMETYGKRIENKDVAWEPIENVNKTQVWCWNRWKMQNKNKQKNGCVGAYRKRKENKGSAWKAKVLQWKAKQAKPSNFF